MEAGLNNAQLHLVKLFSFVKTKTAFSELQDVLMRYYAKEVDRQMDALWDSGKLDADKMNQIRTAHIRTPYK